MSLLDTASLVLTPNAYKEGKLYSVIPSDGSGDFTFTRATTATRVNSDGLVELVPYNLLQRSNTFNNAIWGKLGTPTLTANYDTNPLTGENDAWRFQSSGVDDRIYQVLNNSFCTFSLYAKGSGNIRIQDSSSTHKTTLTLTSSWQRFLIYIPASFTNVQILSSTGGCDATIYGAQVVEGTNALPYQKTETRLNIPRIDYSLGGCPNILLEPQRTNLNTQSEDISTWSRVATTATINTTTAPNGMVTADSLLETTASTTHIAFKDTTGLSGTQYAFSIYAKSIGGRNIQVVGASGFSGSIVVDLSNGNILSGSGVVSNMGDGWFRISITATTTTTTIRAILYTVDGTTSSFAGDVTKGLYLWGAQVEAGSYATSYIPTTTASVTRIADLCSKTSATALIGQTEGTIFIDFTLLPNNANASYLFAVSDGTSANLIRSEILVVSPTLSKFRTGINTLGTDQVDTFTNITQLNNKMAISYKLNDVKIFLNGVLVASDTSATIPATSGVYLGSRNNIGNFIGSYYKSFSLWPTALTNDQLAQLTTI